jgi:hypothetical protein
LIDTVVVRVHGQFGHRSALRRTAYRWDGDRRGCFAVGIDPCDDWPMALRDNFFDSTAPTAWTGLSAPGGRLATENITDMSPFTDKRAGRARWPAQARAGHRHRRLGN